MRTLNRPMFRYGGPIKEGVMHGIREPRRNGGSMSQNVQPSNNGMRSGYAGPKKSSLLKYIPGFNYLAGQTKGIIPRIINKMKPTFKKQPGQVTGGTTGGTARSNKLGLENYKRNTQSKIPFMERAGAFVKENPYFTGVAAPFAVSGAATAAPPVAKGLAGLAEAGVKQVGDLLVPDFLFDQDKYFEDKEKAKLDEELKASKAERDEQARLKALYEEQNPEIREPVKSDDEIREEKIQKYRDIMDIKGMNKDAAYDSLIAASQAINSSGDFKGDLKSGKLINQIIQGASKAYDKPKTTKDAIDSLILKGEIEKDINLSKGNSSTQQLAALADASGRSLKYVANARLSIPNSPGEAKSNLIKLKKTQVTSDEVAGEILRYGEDNGIPFKKHYTTEQKNKVVGEGKKFGSVIELIESEKLDPNGTDDGLYVIGLSIVEVENGVPKLRG